VTICPDTSAPVRENRERLRHQDSSAMVENWCDSLLLRPGRGADYFDQPGCLSVCLCVCLSACISLEPMDRPSRNLVCRYAVAVARPSSAGVALRYVLLVLWMTSRMAVMGGMVLRHLRGRSDLLVVVKFWEDRYKKNCTRKISEFFRSSVRPISCQYDEKRPH